MNVVISGGSLLVCGENFKGQLGLRLANDIYRDAFIEVRSDVVFAAVSVRDDHTMALDDEGNLWSCGNNWCGKLGLSDYINRDALTKVHFELKFMSISSGYDHVITIDIEGNLWVVELIIMDN